MNFYFGVYTGSACELLLATVLGQEELLITGTKGGTQASSMYRLHLASFLSRPLNLYFYYGMLHKFACNPWHKDHANFLRIVPNLIYVLPKRALNLIFKIIYRKLN